MHINIEIPYAYANKEDFPNDYKNAAINKAVNGSYNRTLTSYEGIFYSNDPGLHLWGRSFKDTFASKITLYEILGKRHDQNSDKGTYIFDVDNSVETDASGNELYKTHLNITTIGEEDYYQFFVTNSLSGGISFYCYLKIKDLLYSSNNGNDMLKLYLSTSGTKIEITNNVNRISGDMYIWTLKDDSISGECSCIAVEHEPNSLNSYFIKLAIRPQSIDYTGEISILSKAAFYDYKLNSGAYPYSLNWVTNTPSLDGVPLNPIAEMTESGAGIIPYRLRFALYATKHANLLQGTTPL